MKIIFFGSDDFAAAHLEYLLSRKFSVAACVTQPDRPRDRMKVTFSPIKDIALRENIDCLQPETIKDPAFHLRLRTYGADLFVVIAYGKILPQAVLDIPAVCAVNVHGSLLPQYRGAAPIHWAVINGETQTGVTIIRMSAALDAGDILRQETLPIGENETTESVRRRMMRTGPPLLVETLRSIEARGLQASAQGAGAFTYAPKLTKDMGRIDWTKSARQIHDLVRGLTPWPRAYTFHDGKMLKILKTVVNRGQTPVDNGIAAGQPGQILGINPEGILVACGRGSVLILDVHPASGKPMDAASFARGHHLQTGKILGI